MNGETITVLLVEDNDVDVEAIRRAFKKQRIANPIVVAEDGVAALELLRRAPEDRGISRPFLILLDLNMPRMNGLEFLEELRADADLRDSIVFVLTTSKSEQDKVDSYHLNIAGYMVKGQVGEGFLNLVSMLGHYWRVVAFPPTK